MVEYWKIKGDLCQLPQWQPDCWVRMSMPTSAEIEEALQRFGMPEYFFEDISDADERARYDSDDGWSLIIMRVPYVKENQSRTPYITVPFGIIYKGDVLITVCHFNVSMLNDFVQHQCVRGGGFIDSVDFIFHVFLTSAAYYLRYLKQINQIIERAKYNLDNNIDNKSLIALSRLQDSLTYFITSLKGSESLLAKLKYRLPVDEIDADLIEDVNIEMSQAIETTQVYSTILDSTMNTYSSIINNNMNSVMKVLASVSIILMLPTLIASFLGMNLINGCEERWWGFPAAILLSITVSLSGWLFFRRKKLI